MDCQSCSYSMLNSSDPEVYQKIGGDDLKILIEQKQPLIENPKTLYVPKPVKRLRQKKRVLSTLDIFISIFIVTPCVVGCWRGIWQIMDLYGAYFPAWESFLLGMAAHIVLALGQDVFHYVIVEKERKSWILKMFAVLMMKFYLTVFNVITNMTWRAGWIIFDRWCGLRLSPSGAAMQEGSTNMIWFTLVCALLLFCLKGLKKYTFSPIFDSARFQRRSILVQYEIYIQGKLNNIFVHGC
ncbi:hypothetical protein NQ317_003909 [Molorchus minor]|uniref:Uncharacterized protein n=1 Tax=Molorchus minor TaxID=1323400 RepID=A0ABQ9IXR5_9CUCU|nr:hypothetical protein NQ317_003909 [Molorchus minor]